MEAVERGERRSLIARTFAVLDAFNEGDRRVSLAELARRTAIPKSTVHRITANLVDLRLLERIEGDYRLGVHLFELGSLVPDLRLLREAAIPYMEDLYEVTRETVHLGVPDLPDVLYVLKIAGHNQVVVPTRDGGRMPATCTSLGKAILAFSPRSTVLRLLSSPLPRLTRYSITDANVMVDELAGAARTGVAYDREESVVGAVCVGAAVFGRRGTVRAAVSVTGRTTRFDPQSASAAVRAVSLGITRQLGGSRPDMPGERQEDLKDRLLIAIG